MKRESIQTSDKSKTLLIPEWDETYHSTHGAVTEANYIFIQKGLKVIDKKDVRIFEMGFGTGLNALVSLKFAQQNFIKISYTTIEKYPLSIEETFELGHLKSIAAEELEDAYNKIQLCDWNVEQIILDNFSLRKIEGDIKDLELKDKFDVIFFDAFSPKVQSELWTIDICKKMFDLLDSNGILVTYCAQGRFRRNLEAAGFEVESLPGPPGKREMTRAYKNRV